MSNPNTWYQSQFDEDDAARRFVTKQSRCEQRLGQLDGDDGEAPVPDAIKDELRGMGHEDEVSTAS